MTGNNSHRHKQDRHYIKAKKEGYRARSAYKLLDIHRKYNIFKRAFYILDVGSAPGSWLQVAQNYVQHNIKKYNDKYYHRDHYKIMGVDIKHISPLEDIKIVKMDFTEPKFNQIIQTYFNEEPLDLILSDASIKKSGNHFSDHVRQIKLCYEVLDIAEKFLKFQGNLVLKLFQGQDMKTFKKDLRRIFKKVKAYKPPASKSKSNEMFFICRKKL
jgi:23S rRNA (uridine2552-2'-O)-methyltransferase